MESKLIEKGTTAWQTCWAGSFAMCFVIKNQFSCRTHAMTNNWYMQIKLVGTASCFLNHIFNVSIQMHFTILWQQSKHLNKILLHQTYSSFVFQHPEWQSFFAVFAKESLLLCKVLLPQVLSLALSLSLPRSIEYWLLALWVIEL